jgi:hypothetical protein
MLFLLTLAAACSTPSLDSGPACPGLDCVDTLTLTVLNPDGSPADRFSGSASGPDGVEVAFACDDSASADADPRCRGEGRVELLLYGASVQVHVDQGDDAPSFDGAVEPAWEAPYDSEECGHYCYLAEASVTLVP